MENSIKTDEIYEVKFEQLVETEKQQLSAVNDIMEGLMDVSVSMGSTREKIGRIVNYKVGDIIVLDISVNGKLIASGESMILDNKLAIRLSNVKTDDEN